MIAYVAGLIPGVRREAARRGPVAPRAPETAADRAAGAAPEEDAAPAIASPAPEGPVERDAQEERKAEVERVLARARRAERKLRRRALGEPSAEQLVIRRWIADEARMAKVCLVAACRRARRCRGVAGCVCLADHRERALAALRQVRAEVSGRREKG